MPNADPAAPLAALLAVPAAGHAAAPGPAIDEDVLFRTLFGAYPDALIVANGAGEIVLANPAAAQLLGYTVEQLVGLGVDALVPDAIRPRHAAYRHSYGRNPSPRPMGTQMELVAKRRDGSEVLVEIALSPLQSHGLPLVVAAIRDIGAYPRVKQALQRARYSEHLAQMGRLAVDSRDPQVLLRQVPVVAAEALQVEVAVVHLLGSDRAAFRIASSVGVTPAEALGEPLANRADTPAGHVLAQGRPVVVGDFATEDRFVVPRAFVDAGAASGLAVPLSDRGRPIGTLAVRSRTRRSFGTDEVLFLESLSNLLATSLQRAETEEALGHAQRLESVGQLTGGIAHDFNNLLTVIQGNLHVLEELPALEGEAYGQQLVAAATRATRRGAELTGKLLAFSRRQVLQPSAVDVRVLLQSLADMLRRTLDQRVVIEVEVAGDCPRLRADPGQLESALLNIAINARDAMPEGGTLRFRAAPCEALPGGLGAGEALVGEARAGEAAARPAGDEPAHDAHAAPPAPPERFVAISISDTGAGMSDEIRERAFEPFFTTKEAGRGTGLGLSTVYGFVTQSHGLVEIDSTLGAGTTLTLYIPQATGTPAAARQGGTADPAGAAVRPGLRVLLVEDDAEVRNVARTFLEALGCVVTEAASGEHALLALEADAARGPAFDVLLTDIALGAGMRGTELAALARQRLPGMAVLLMSGFSAELLDADRNSPPDWELLRKPYSRNELAQALLRVTG